MNGTIKERNNYLYITFRQSRFDKPVIDILWYPLNKRAWHLDHLIGREVHRVASGIYEDSSRLRYYLPQGGDTKAEFIETEAVPRPKTRVETRWQSGRWEKYLKSRGWVVA